nr:uncharacterized protein LOC111414074 [Onthophagus taurus]
MIPYLRKMIIDADMFEELLHNTCIVTRCWKMLNCSFAVKPEDILDPNSVHMLMLIAYLFEVLPSMYPYETIDFTIGLSQKAFNTIVLKNINDFPICYKVIFFSNEDNCFTTDEDMYVIPPGKSCKILITYYAKFAKNITCTLFLSGENDSYHFSRNRAFTLIGIPDVTYMTSTIKYPIYLYEVSDVSFTVKSPYSIETAYNIQLTYDMVQTPDDLANIPFAQKEELQTPSKFMPVSTTTQFDETGVFEFQAFCTILMYEEQSVYIYFRNPNVGDFAINFEIIMKESRSKEVIEVFLPKNVMDFRQSSTGGGLERVFLEVPCRNRLFWNTIMELMLRICEGDVLDFFKRNIGTTIGMQILQEIILGSGIDKSNLCDSVKYDIVLDNTDSGIILPDNVFIEDECSHNTISIPLKFLNTGDLPSDFTFSLISQDGRYRRYYVTNFTCDP